jgi:hypothetical protein
MMTPALGMGIWMAAAVFGLLIFGIIRKRPIYVMIAADDDPLEHGMRNFRERPKKVNALRLAYFGLYLLSMAVLLGIVAWLDEPAIVLWQYYHPALVAVATETAAPSLPNETLPEAAPAPLDPCASPYPSDWTYPSECIP